VAFLDDDVVPGDGWERALRADLAGLGADVAGSQGRLRVPLPGDRRPTDEERNVAGLETARWATADLAYRRSVLEAVGGFDERFRRAYREDADLGLRVVAGGWRIVRGDRWSEHPVRPAPWWASVARQRGNAADPLMRALHGRRWREAAGVPRGRFRRHLLATAVLVAAAGASLAGARRLAAVAAGAWAASTAELAWARIRPGPATPAEVGAMVATSVALPPVAVAHRVAGEVGAVARARRPGPVDRQVVLDRAERAGEHDLAHRKRAHDRVAPERQHPAGEALTTG
jgi:hypothetical protein